MDSFFLLRVDFRLLLIELLLSFLANIFFLRLLGELLLFLGFDELFHLLHDLGVVGFFNYFRNLLILRDLFLRLHLEIVVEWALVPLNALTQPMPIAVLRLLLGHVLQSHLHETSQSGFMGPFRHGGSEKCAKVRE